MDKKSYQMPSDRVAKTFGEIEKFNPYHDRLGRFTTSGAAASFTYSPGKSKAHDMAIAREKDRIKNMAASQKPKEETGPGTKKLSLNDDYIRRADNNSMMGNAGSVRAKEAQSRIDDFKNAFKEQDDWTDEQRAYVKQRHDEYVDLVSEYYNDQIRRTADNVSWAVAGPANYNFRASQKKNDAQMKKVNEYEQKLSNFKENTQKKLKSMEPEEKQISYWRNGKWQTGETINAADPLAEKKLTAKLEYHQEQQQKMKAANAYYKKNGTMSGFEGFSESTNQRINETMKDSRYGNKPFQSFSLTNNNAQIKATQSRLKQIQENKQKSGSSGATRKFNGGSVIRNGETNRLQIKFDGVPDASTRQKLKSNGWRWSPKNGVWQRQLTDNAERSARSLLDGLEKSFPEEDVFEITKADEDKRLVFGWANVATRANGDVIQDWQNDIVTPEELEKSAYQYVLDFRDGGEEHMQGLRKKCRMVESVVFTEEKLKAMGIPLGTVPLGWWIGFYVDDDSAWEKVKNGTYTQFSIEGSGKRKPVENLESRMRKSFDGKRTAKSFSEIAKFNPYHDRLGRFTTSGGATSFTFSPGKSKAHDLAIERAKRTAGNREKLSSPYVISRGGVHYRINEIGEKEGQKTSYAEYRKPGTDWKPVEDKKRLADLRQAYEAGKKYEKYSDQELEAERKRLKDVENDNYQQFARAAASRSGSLVSGMANAQSERTVIEDVIRNRKRQQNISDTGVKAIQIDTGNGSVLTYRRHSDGTITDIDGYNKKDTNGLSLDQIMSRAKQAGYKVTTFDDNQLRQRESERADYKREMNNLLNDMYAKDRTMTYKAPRKGWKGH